MAQPSAHMSNIPQAVRIAASTDAGVDAALKEQAIEYLAKVKALCEETWQDCLALYLQGAGASEPGQTGKDGKEKMGTELRMYCEQVFEAALVHQPHVIAPDALQAMYTAMMSFITTEWVDGYREGGQSFFRNKLSFDLAHLFIISYPTHNPTFLQPFFAYLQSDPSASPSPIAGPSRLPAINFDPLLLSIHLFNEIALEIHDSTVKSARPWSKERQDRDGIIRDTIRSSGDERLAIEGLLAVAEKALGASGDEAVKKKWIEAAELAMRTLAAWTPWVDLAVALTPTTLAFYRRLLAQPTSSLRTAATGIIRTFVAKGIQDPSDKLQVMKVLDVISTLDPLEAETRGSDDDAVLAFRAALGGVLAVYGTELIEFWENDEYPESLRKEAETMIDAARPLLLRFMSDPTSEVPNASGPFISDLLKVYKRLHVAKVPPPVRAGGKMLPPAIPPAPIQELPQERRQFLSSLLDVCVRQLAWPSDAEWEPPTGDEPDPDDDLAMLQAKRIMCRSYIESIAQIDRSLHKEVVARIVLDTLQAIQAGASSVPWQQAELALHLVYTFGEMSKNNTRAAFFDLPAELATKSGRDRLHRISVNKMHMDGSASGRTTPSENGMAEEMSDPIPGVYYGGYKDKVDYDQYPLTLLGQLLELCINSGVANFPHASVTLQYFEIAVRYVEFWRSKPKTIKPMFEAMLNGRGIHHEDEAVRRRCFYLFSKFVKECRSDLEIDMLPIILDSMRDVMVIKADLPKPDVPDEDVLVKATTGRSLFADQLHLFEAAGNLVYLTKVDAGKQISLLENIAGPLMNGIGAGLAAYSASPTDLQAVLSVHHHLLALGNFAKGFPQVGDSHVDALPYQGPFKQMTEALLQALEGMKTQRIVRDSARFAFSQFVNAIGTTVAELVPQFVQKVVTEFEPAELIDFMTFLGLLMHRLKTNTFETMNMLLLPLLSRIFAVLQQPITGTDDASIHRKLKDSYLTFFISLMNANLDGVFISPLNKSEFENLLTALLDLTTDNSDANSQRLAFSFFAKSVIAWGTSPTAAANGSVFADSAMSEKSKMVANGLGQATNQHAVPKEERAAQALEGYENFIYQRLVPSCFQVPAAPSFNIRGGQPVIFEIAMLLRNTLQARGQEAIDFLLQDMLPRLNCPAEYAAQLVQSLRTEQAKDFRKVFAEFCKALKGTNGR